MLHWSQGRVRRFEKILVQYGATLYRVRIPLLLFSHPHSRSLSLTLSFLFPSLSSLSCFPSGLLAATHFVVDSKSRSFLQSYHPLFFYTVFQCLPVAKLYRLLCLFGLSSTGSRVLEALAPFDGLEAFISCIATMRGGMPRSNGTPHRPNYHYGPQHTLPRPPAPHPSWPEPPHRTA